MDGRKTMSEREDRRWGRLGGYEEDRAEAPPERAQPRAADNSWWRERESAEKRDDDYRAIDVTRTHGFGGRAYGRQGCGDRSVASSTSSAPGARSSSGGQSWRPEADVRSSALGQIGPRDELLAERERRSGVVQAEATSRYEPHERAPSLGDSARPGGFRGRGPRGYHRSDERVREDVCEALTDNDELDASDLDVGVSSGEVTLSGLVDDRRSKRLAEDVASSCRGVKDVHNLLRIKQREEPTAHSFGASHITRASERPFEPGPRNRFS